VSSAEVTSGAREARSLIEPVEGERAAKPDERAHAGDSAAAASWSLPRTSWIAGLVILIVTALFVMAAHRAAPKHLRTVVPGVLYRSAVLDPEQLGRVVERLGVRTVVNLRSVLENEKGSWRAGQEAELDRRGIAMLDIPMHTGWPPERAEIDTWLELMRDPARQPVLVHCQYGVVRTGMMVSIYEIELLGHDPEAVWADFDLFGRELREPVRSRVEAFVEGYERTSRRDR